LTAAGSADPDEAAGLVLDALEIAWGATLGMMPSALDAATSTDQFTVRSALEAAVRRALLRPPCVVAFSGGRDSSAILALAMDLARREGHPPPLAVTQRFPGADAADESSWQELVIGHVGGIEWQRIETGPDDADLTGPTARAVLARHGVLFPANAYLTTNMLRIAHGGSLLTGVGGDEVLGFHAHRAVQLLAMRTRPRRSDMLVFRSLVQRERWAHREPERSWLQREANDEAMRRSARLAAAYPLRFDRALRFWLDDRYVRAIRHTRSLLAADHDVLMVDPFIEPVVVRRLADEGGFVGFRSRTEALRALAGDLLPAALIERSTKATFGQPIFGVHFEEFRSQWRGDGIDADLVDAAQLRSAWSMPHPDFRTALLVHDVIRRTGASTT
jgi:asparagine synthetase B (glutamine-hydrolysing)